MTNYDLLSFHKEFDRLIDSNPGLHFLLQQRISNFYNKAGLRITTIIETQNKLARKYFVFKKEKGTDDKETEVMQYITIFKEETIKKKHLFFFTKTEVVKKPVDKKPVLIEGMKMEDFDKETKEFMSKENPIQF